MATEKRLIDANEFLKRIEQADADVIESPPDGYCFLDGPDFGYTEATINRIVRDMPTVEAVEVSRLGKLGRLMMPYKGCPRGHMGAKGALDGDLAITELEPIEDVDGNRWIPVLEEDLRILKTRARKEGGLNAE